MRCRGRHGVERDEVHAAQQILHRAAAFPRFMLNVVQVLAFLSVIGVPVALAVERLIKREIPKEIITIMQGTTVLAVVVAYELANRLSRRAQQRRVGAAVAAPGSEQVADRNEVPA